MSILIVVRKVRQRSPLYFDTPYSLSLPTNSLPLQLKQIVMVVKTNNANKEISITSVILFGLVACIGCQAKKILFVLAGIVSLSTDGTGFFRIYFANLPLVAFAILTSESMMGTSVSTPTVVANAAPLCNPKRLMATATASSKKLEAPIIPAGAATS